MKQEILRKILIAALLIVGAAIVIVIYTSDDSNKLNLWVELGLGLTGWIIVFFIFRIDRKNQQNNETEL